MDSWLVNSHIVTHKAKMKDQVERHGNVWLPHSLKSELKKAISLEGYAVLPVPSSARSARLEAGMVQEIDSMIMGGVMDLEVIADWEYDSRGKPYHTDDPEGRRRKQGSLLLLPSGRTSFVPYFDHLVSKGRRG